MAAPSLCTQDAGARKENGFSCSTRGMVRWARPLQVGPSHLKDFAWPEGVARSGLLSLGAVFSALGASDMAIGVCRLPVVFTSVLSLGLNCSAPVSGGFGGGED